MASRSVAADENPRPYRLALAVDVALVLAGGALYAGAVRTEPDVDPPACFPCDRRAVNGVDRAALGLDFAGARRASDATALAVALGATVGDLVDVAVTRGGLPPAELAADGLVLAEVYLLNAGLTGIVKNTVRRPRPTAYDPEGHAEAGDDPDASRSFYSGHTSTSFACAVAASSTYWRRHPRGGARWVVLAAGLTLGALTAAFRVAGGEHFPSDVLAGAAAGSAVGAGVPWLHAHGAVPGPGALLWRF